jgi:hypothetical protein
LPRLQAKASKKLALESLNNTPAGIITRRTNNHTYVALQVLLHAYLFRVLVLIFPRLVFYLLLAISVFLSDISS